ncbi:MAG: DUF1501 domain-containing protein [Planctomycetes bacterium]|nr:DUF1501 domain-containing protein [Planctomycetota bacterium]
MFDCNRFRTAPLTRREMLATCAGGFGAVALAALSADATPQAAPGIHHAPRAKNVIFLYMDGGVSQVDSFDYKPMLERYQGRDPHSIFRVEPTQFNNVGRVMMSPWRFRQYGQCGRRVSELFPNIARHVDDLAFVHSMTSRFPEHTSANYFLHTGNGLQGRPSMGAWINYGLGSENRNLPGFIVLNGGLIPPGGLDNFNSGFLPAAYQGSVFRPGDPPVANIRPLERDPNQQRQKLELLRQLDRAGQERLGRVDEIDSAIANAETAFRMQAAVPELMDLTGESNATRALYGITSTFAGTRTFGTECLIARRLVERGVRFVELTCPGVGHDRWDQHGNLRRGHADNARAVDQPIAALLTDLKTRGLWNDTLVVWTGEFGRTPFAQGSDGRDHNPFGFTLWLAGGGVKGGTSCGATDEFGYKAVDGVREIHDLHATMLHLLGVDHTRQTFRFGGRDMRLTDVHGEVIHEVLA